MHLRVYMNEYPLCTGGFSIYISQAQPHSYAFAPLRTTLRSCFVAQSKTKENKTKQGKKKENTQNSLGWSRSEGYFIKISFLLDSYSCVFLWMGTQPFLVDWQPLWIHGACLSGPPGAVWNPHSYIQRIRARPDVPTPLRQPCGNHLNPTAMLICLRRTIQYCKRQTTLLCEVE